MKKTKLLPSFKSKMANMLVMVIATALSGCDVTSSTDVAEKKDVDSQVSQVNSPLNEDWPAYGRDHGEQRFSPLTTINSDNVGQLGMAWHYDMREGRGVEATPIVVDGKLFVTSAWSVVHALDAVTGEELWVFDPEVDRAVGAKTCCGVINRGVAYFEGKVFVAALDGRLIALDATSGKPLWQTQTIDDTSEPYVITGAPRAARGLVFIGNSGADFGVRGYVGAYDAETGEKVWRFYTVPGNPALGPDGEASDSIMAKAAETWTGEWWQQGGGGTVWDSITYDPELDQVYIGVGNGSPWNQQVRSPGGGDNWFLASIVALDRATGEYLWHYQTTPGDTWDLTATQSIILAELVLDGEKRKVLMQAPKNGFYYVIDRTSGEFISAGNIVPMAKTADTPEGEPISWAYGIDPETGRPLENIEARYLDGQEVRVHPVGPGAHGWQPMAYSPQTGYAYIPVQDLASTFRHDPDYKPVENRRASGIVHGKGLPKDPKLRASVAKNVKARLVAWDPVEQREAWRVNQPYAGNGGVLATAGNLVFQSDAAGVFNAYDAGSGKQLWSFDAQATAQGGPVTYQIDGNQYIAIAVGNGGASFMVGAMMTPQEPAPWLGRVLVFKLNANKTLPPVDRPIPPLIPPPAMDASAADTELGDKKYHEYCAGCHGISAISGFVTPDLRRSPMLQSAETFRQILKDGLLLGRGMPGFGQTLSDKEVEAIRAYLASEARFLLDQQAQNMSGMEE